MSDIERVIACIALLCGATTLALLVGRRFLSETPYQKPAVVSTKKPLGIRVAEDIGLVLAALIGFLIVCLISASVLWQNPSNTSPKLAGITFLVLLIALGFGLDGMARKLFKR